MQSSGKLVLDIDYYVWMINKITSYKTVLEVGCGTGYGTLTLLEGGHKVIALDKNEACISKAKKLIQQKGYSVGKLPDADAMFLETDIVIDEFYSGVLDTLFFDVVICWNVGSFWNKNTIQFYLNYLLKYGLNIYQIQHDPESSYAELVLWNTCKIAAMKRVPVQIVDRAEKIVNETNDEYYCTLKQEFNFSVLEFDNIQADSISHGGRMLVTRGIINREKIIPTILVSIFMK